MVFINVISLGQSNCICRSNVWRFFENDSDSFLKSLIVTRNKSRRLVKNVSRVFRTSFLNATQCESGYQKL